MKYDTYRIRAEGCPYYFKAATSEHETEVYLVRSDKKGDVLGSLKIHEGAVLPRSAAVGCCMTFIGIISKAVFDLKIEESVPSTGEVPVSTEIVVGAKLTERKVICAKKRCANTTKRKAVK